MINTFETQLFAEEFNSIKLFILVDEYIDTNDLDTVCWIACSNIDPERDLRLARAPRQQIIADACMKYPHNYDFPREWPQIVTSSKTAIQTVDNKWKQLELGELIPSPSLKFLRQSF